MALFDFQVLGQLLLYVVIFICGFCVSIPIGITGVSMFYSWTVYFKTTLPTPLTQQQL